jgi:hypothetical protein
MWEISRCPVTASLVALSAPPAGGHAGFITPSLLSTSLLIPAVRVWWLSGCFSAASLGHSESAPHHQRSCWGHCFILIFEITVNKAGPCCGVVVGIKIIPYCLSKDTRKMAADRDCFGSLFSLYHPFLSGLQALAEVV